ATSEEAPIPTLAIDPQVEQKQITRLAETRKTRDRGRWNESIDALRNAAKRGDELMPRFVECARANASVGEQVLVLKEVFGEYHDPGYF
ncbi:MAG: methylmalonyl-CoA mutase, partial [Chloroflexi bacterium]